MASYTETNRNQAGRPAKRGWRGLASSPTFVGYLFVAPILILMGIWFYYPLLRSFIYSFQDISFLNPDAAQFIGLSNYAEMLKDDDFWGALQNSVILTAVAVPLQTVISLLIAVNLNKIARLKTVFRTLYYLPYITSTVAVTTVFMYLFMQRDGIATKFFTLFGMEDVSWYASTKYALPFLIVLTVWTYVGFYVVVYLAGLQTIPGDVYEAGTVDGANAWQRLWYITVPMLKPTTFLVLTSGMIYAMQLFDQPYALARNGSLGSPAGATSTIVIYFYSQAFNFNRAGYGSAAAFIIFALIVIFTIVQKRFVKEDV
ncbi:MULTISPECIES: carbohydrate ABC transporter permease [unclassified Paenibacillus]|uniref:carbohydrate ABC transporter permease n=1 Tax=unclassified Paenibacillus TaxID=185978 RepID=UPI001C0F7C79|nr:MULTISPECIES: sugar ABC transporter permease [unclassified Paenibacillus]MBU5444758.1 sugar ABC transporter permease [Paenibacillus sp. MSJ-34]CAH0119333.1 L-arabinose transport system permease protein AraP [Paenibacillus sp. CECT 9249]